MSAAETLSPRPAPSWDEAARVAALRRYRILDTPAESGFDEITRIAALVCRAPIAVVNFIEDTRQWFKAEIGLGVRETPLDISFCAQAILQPGVFVIPDARKDARFACNPLVTGEPHLRFYAGALLETPDRLPIGTVCVLDTEPRPEGLRPDQREILRALARQVMLQLELRQREDELRASQERLNLALDASKVVGTWLWEVACDRITADERFAWLFNVSPELARNGAPLSAFLDAIHPEDRPRVADEIANAVAQGGEYATEYRVIATDGSIRWISARGHCERDEAGRPVRFPGAVVDVTPAKANEQALREREAELARVQRIGQVGGLEVDLRNGFRNRRSPEYLRIHGLPPEADRESHDEWVRRIHPDDRERVESAFRAAVAGRAGEYTAEYRIVRPSDGAVRWISATAEIERDGEGCPLRLVGAHIDITERKQAEEARELISRELSHRIKNIFAIVSGLVSLSARGHEEAKDFAREFRDRLHALALAHEYVQPRATDAGPIATTQTIQGLLRTLLRPYAVEGRERFLIDGEDAEVGEKAATALALIAHEQATNAAKYGALSLETGHVTITGRREGDAYILVWRERGGPPIHEPPARQGFGTLMAGRSVSGQLGGMIAYDWAPEGLTMQVTIPLANLAR
ncbi:MAG TPA: PAS domain-containing protein [Beijerinckiaceae bacterium]|jgi:PAS domain S-box-containing protein